MVVFCESDFYRLGLGHHRNNRRKDNHDSLDEDYSAEIALKNVIKLSSQSANKWNPLCREFNQAERCLIVAPVRFFHQIGSTPRNVKIASSRRRGTHLGPPLTLAANFNEE